MGSPVNAAICTGFKNGKHEPIKGKKGWVCAKKEQMACVMMMAAPKKHRKEGEK